MFRVQDLHSEGMSTGLVFRGRSEGVWNGADKTNIPLFAEVATFF